MIFHKTSGLDYFRSVEFALLALENAVMEIEATLRLAGGEGSSLTRSFWYGKFLQLLPEEELVKYNQPLTHHGAQSIPVNSSESPALGQPMDEKISQLTHALVLSSCDGGNLIELNTEQSERNTTRLGGDVCSPDFELLRPHIVEALKCLKCHETSLSPNVYDLVVNSIQSAPPDLDLSASISESAFLLKDCTLNWDVLSLHLNKGNLL